NGGAIGALSANVTVEQSTFSGNSASGSGGAIASPNSIGTLTVRNSTTNGNSADTGGAIFNASATVLENDTLSGDNGGEITNSAGTNRAANTTVSGDAGSHGTRPVIDNGHNLQFGDTTCGFTLTANPLLGPLADNGGPTQTMALGASSPAIGAGGSTVCLASPGVGDRDQRGNPRNAGTRAACDI